MIYTAKNTARIGKPAKVYLDGVLQEKAIMADDVEGVVEVLKFVENDDPLIGADGEFMTEFLSGAVKVVFDDDA